MMTSQMLPIMKNIIYTRIRFNAKVVQKQVGSVVLMVGIEMSWENSWVVRSTVSGGSHTG
jgi:hypothetical protein